MGKYDYEIDGYLVQWDFDSKSGYEERRFDEEDEAVAFAKQLKGLVRVQQLRNVIGWYE